MKRNIAIVASRFNEEITNEMIKHALNYSKKSDLNVMEIIEVPGAFEVPFAVQGLLKRKEIDGVATLGAVIKGETAHDRLIMHSIGQALINLSLKYDKPVTLGIIGPNATYEQAAQRKHEYAKRSIYALKKMIEIKNK